MLVPVFVDFFRRVIDVTKELGEIGRAVQRYHRRDELFIDRMKQDQVFSSGGKVSRGDVAGLSEPLAQHSTEKMAQVTHDVFSVQPHTFQQGQLWMKGTKSIKIVV